MNLKMGITRKLQWLIFWPEIRLIFREMDDIQDEEPPFPPPSLKHAIFFQSFPLGEDKKEFQIVFFFSC